MLFPYFPIQSSPIPIQSIHIYIYICVGSGFLPSIQSSGHSKLSIKKWGAISLTHFITIIILLNMIHTTYNTLTQYSSRANCRGVILPKTPKNWAKWPIFETNCAIKKEIIIFELWSGIFLIIRSQKEYFKPYFAPCVASKKTFGWPPHFISPPYN